MMNRMLALAALASVAALNAGAQSAQYPPVAQYLMARDAEIALARSAAPAAISAHATVKVLTISGYEVAQHGDNGSVCLVMRGFSAPTYTPSQFRDLVYDPAVRAPICFTAPAARTVLPYYELRTTLGLAGKTPDAIAEGIQAAYAKGELPRREGPTVAYMYSKHQHLGPGIGAWRPHAMIFAPYYENVMAGGNPFGSALPQVTDDAGTPFAVLVVPVDGGGIVSSP